MMGGDEGSSVGDDADAKKSPEPETADAVDADDPHKVEKLTSMGHDGDPNEGSD